MGKRGGASRGKAGRIAVWGVILARKMDFATQLDRIIDAAGKAGADTNVLYLTTLDRYKTQISIMEKLKASIAQDRPTVTKEYVKGRQNIVINPAITEYNKTASAANNTAQTLIKIVQSLGMNSI